MNTIDLNSIKIYIMPFDINGIYVTDWIDITKYVINVSSLTTDIDSNDYSLGVYRNSNITLTLNNRDGKFSDVEILQSFFRYTRKDTLVKITYDYNPEYIQIGIVDIGDTYLHEEIELFKGLLTDESYKFDAKSEQAQFNVLGMESIFDRAIVPFADLTIGDTITDILYKILNKTFITQWLTISLANINVGVDAISDTIAWLENKSVKEALNKLLLVSNSVLYIINDVVYISDKSESVALQHTFYGQASQLGIENIIDIKNYNNGLQRVKNYFYWKDSSDVSYDVDSINLYGYKKDEIDFEVFTNSTKRTTLMAALLAEYKDKKIEMELSTPLNYDTLDLQLKDKVNVDYPTVYYASEFGLPICGVAICGDEDTATLPTGLWSLNISSSKFFKILKKTVDLKQLVLTFKLREV